jgi:hypothetical protein
VERSALKKQDDNSGDHEQDGNLSVRRCSERRARTSN